MLTFIVIGVCIAGLAFMWAFATVLDARRTAKDRARLTSRPTWSSKTQFTATTTVPVTPPPTPEVTAPKARAPRKSRAKGAQVAPPTIDPSSSTDGERV